MTQVEAWEAQEEQFDSGAPRHVLHHVTDFVQAGSSGNATKVVLNAAPLDDDLLDAGVPLPVGVGGLVNYKNGRMGLKNSVRDANVELAWLLLPLRLQRRRRAALPRGLARAQGGHCRRCGAAGAIQQPEGNGAAGSHCSTEAGRLGRR